MKNNKTLKISRVEIIKILLKTFTGVTGNKIPVGLLTTIAKQVGVSREYVRQIAVKEEYIMPRKTVRDRVVKLKCKECKKTFPIKGPHSSKSYKRACCSPECYIKRRDRLYWATTKCKYCGGDIKYLKSLERNGKKPVFHSKICQGKYIGKFNAGKRRKKRARWRMSQTDLKRFFPKPFTATDFIHRLNYSPGCTGIASEILKRLIYKNYIKKVCPPKSKKQKAGCPPQHYKVITIK